jgi:hypothetical protein
MRTDGGVTYNFLGVHPFASKTLLMPSPVSPWFAVAD